MFQKVGEALLDLVYPRTCLGCQQTGVLLCDRCVAEVDYYFLPVSLRLEPLFVDQYLVVARMEGIVRKLVHELKYNTVKELGQIAGALLYLGTDWPDADLVTTVPLHSHRLRDRGFNQAEVIGRSFADLAHLPFQEVLKRTADTPHQAQQQTKQDREQNVTDYFALTQGAITHHSVVNRTVILIDDVCTTGITLNYCAKALKQAGCRRVTAITLAHGK